MQLRILILDFTALSHVDLAGVNAMRNIVDEYCDIGVSVYITGCSGKYIYKSIFDMNSHLQNLSYMTFFIISFCQFSQLKS